MQGAASPLPEREVSSPPPLSLPPQAATKDFAIALESKMLYYVKHTYHFDKLTCHSIDDEI